MRASSFILGVARYAITRLADIGCRVLSFKGEDMAPKTATRATPETAEPIVDIADIDEALHYTSLIAQRDDQWRRWTDGLLDERLRLIKEKP